jgi:nucleotide-binding universal stress UspA family protein
MVEPRHPAQDGPPRRILLATDLSCRCDRALDRALQLAEAWDAKLVLLHVLKGEASDPMPGWRRGRSPAEVATRQVKADLHGSRVEWDLVLERGDPAEAILRRAEELACGLIVTGVARNEPLGRSTLGDIVQQLSCRAPLPLLVVKSRVHAPYARLVVATDFSEPSRHALERALGLLPGVEVALFHAFRVPFEGFIDKAANLDQFRAVAEAECAAFLPGVQADAAAIGRMKTLIECGSPEVLIAGYVLDQSIDLVALGTQGRTGLSGFLVGSTARRLLGSLPCDVLLVRGPPAQ